jgi:hypothetical protein
MIVARQPEDGSGRHVGVAFEYFSSGAHSPRRRGERAKVTLAIQV